MRVSWWFLSGGESPFFGVFDLLLGLSLFLCCAPLLKLKCEGLLPQSTPSTCGKLLSACHEIILFMHPTAALLHRPLVRAAHQHHHVAAVTGHENERPLVARDFDLRLSSVATSAGAREPVALLAGRQKQCIFED